MKIKDFVIAMSVSEALEAMNKFGEDAFLIAGGTSLGFLPENMEKVAIDISQIGLSWIERNNICFKVGATTQLDKIAKYKADGWVLDTVAWKTATQQIRNLSTIGGNIVRIFRWCDMPVAMLVLGAKMHIIKGKTTEPEIVIDSDEFFKSQPFRHFCEMGLLTEIELQPILKNSGFAFHKEVLTSPGFSLMTAAANISTTDSKISNAKIAVSAAVPFPMRITELEKELTGLPVNINEEDVEEIVISSTSNIEWRGHEGISGNYASALSVIVITDVIMLAIKNAIMQIEK